MQKFCNVKIDARTHARTHTRTHARTHYRHILHKITKKNKNILSKEDNFCITCNLEYINSKVYYIIMGFFTAFFLLSAAQLLLLE